MNLRKKIIIPVLVGLTVGATIASTVAYAKITYHGRFFPGTHMAGVDLSKKTADEAIELLKKKEQAYLETVVKVQFQEEEIEVLPEDLGINILLEESVRSVDEINGEEVDLFNLLQIIGEDSKDRRDIGLIVTIDNHKLEAKLNEAFRLEDLRPKSATFKFEKNKLVIEDAKDGLVIDEDDLIKQLKDSAKTLQPRGATIKHQDKTPLVSRELLEQQEEAVKESVRHQFTLIDPIYADDWDLSLAEHMDWVEFVQLQEVAIPLFQSTELLEASLDINEEPLVGIKINQAKLDEYVDEEIAQWLDRPPEDVVMTMDEEGQVQIEGKGKDGVKIKRSALKSSIELAVANKIKDIPIPVITMEPELDISENLQALGIKERLAVGHTSYYGSPANRVHNIKTGAARYNGVLLAPDEVFSFNRRLGRVDASTGYRKELVIKPEGTIPEYGGGICQVSTTFYRAILMAGLPIVERNPHSYSVSYYAQIMGHGLDATIYLGGPDLKFQNDTGKHLLIQTFVEEDYEIYFVFYGADLGRSVELEGPYLSNYHNPGGTQYLDSTELAPGETKQVEKPHTGFNAMWYRHLTDGEGNTTVEPLLTKYRAVPRKIMVGVEPNAQS
jgi:vancomycin resistance protein YoaR